MNDKLYSVFNVYLRCKGISRDEMKLLYRSIKCNPGYDEIIRNEHDFYGYTKPIYKNQDILVYRNNKWQNIESDLQHRYEVSYYELLFLLNNITTSFTYEEMLKGASEIKNKVKDINFINVHETKPDITRSDLEEVSSKIPNLEEQLTLLNKLARKAGFEANVIFIPIIKN